MSSADLWISARITESRSNHPAVTDAVSARMEEMLKGQLSERQLTATELTKLAKALIVAMTSASPETEANR